MSPKRARPRRRVGALAAVLAACAGFAAAEAAEVKTSWTGYARVLHGPMIGAVAPDSVRLWTRLSGPNDVQIEYGPAATPDDLHRTAPRRAAKADDYTVVNELADLQPGTRYRYRVLVDGAPDMNLGPRGFFSVQTAPAPGAPASFSVAFGSCARVERYPVQPVWSAIRALAPDAMLWLGDNVYADTLDPDIMAECYQRQRGLPELQEFIRTVPQLAIWDDHDFGLNDSDRRSPAREDALRVFRRYWANPAYGLPDTPGVFFQFHYGGVDFFLLDNRYHRDPIHAGAPEPRSALGAAQKDWLKRQLRGSRAPFKVLVSGQPWSDEKGGGESWQSFAEERAELFAFLREEGIGGVVLLSGDNHVAELNCHPESERGGYDLFEISASPLAQEPAASWLNYRTIPRIRQVYFGGSNFGRLTFDLTRPDPTLTVTLHNERGDSVWAPLVLRASELRNGTSVWRERMDRTSRQRWQRHERGEPYYGAP